MDATELDYALALLARNAGLTLRFEGDGCRITREGLALYTGACDGAFVFLAELMEIA